MKRTTTPSEKVAQERAFARAYSRFKLWIAFKDFNNREFYQYEAQESIRQINCHRTKTVTLDCRIGYNGLLALLETFKGRYWNAILYDQYQVTIMPGGQKKRGVPVEKYNRFGEKVEWRDLDFSTPLTVANVIYDGKGGWKLKRISEPIPSQSIKEENEWA